EVPLPDWTVEAERLDDEVAVLLGDRHLADERCHGVAGCDLEQQEEHGDDDEQEQDGGAEDSRVVDEDAAHRDTTRWSALILIRRPSTGSPCPSAASRSGRPHASGCARTALAICP